jgi:gluconokinase
VAPGLASVNTTNSQPIYLGIDLGTGSCKVVVVDENAQILGFAASEYPSESVSEKWNEQNPESMLTGMMQAVRHAIETSGIPGKYCRGLSIGGALHSLLAVDRHSKPLTGVITWADGRAAAQAQETRKNPQGAIELYQQTGCPVHGMYPLYKINWLHKKNPEIFQKATRFLSAKEYIVYRLTGEYLVDYSLAAGSGLLNAHDLKWNSGSLDFAGIDSSYLSAICNPRQMISGLNPELAAAMGIATDISLVLGSSDAANSNLGAGAVLPDQATCMIGTSGAFRIISPQPIIDPHARTWCYAIDETHWLAGGAINNGGIALSWLRDTINQAFPSLSQAKELSFDNLLHLAEQVGAGANGLFCLPFFAGERSPNYNINARAMFCGMTLEHDARHLARSLIEGIAFRMKSLNDAMNEAGITVRKIHASGGYARSDFWLQVVASVLNHDLVTLSWGETSSLGAAFWTLLGSGRLTSIEESGTLVSIDKICQPIPEEARIYNQIYPIHTSIYSAMVPVFDQIDAFQQQN